MLLLLFSSLVSFHICRHRSASEVLQLLPVFFSMFISAISSREMNAGTATSATGADTWGSVEGSEDKLRLKLHEKVLNVDGFREAMIVALKSLHHRLNEIT